MSFAIHANNKDFLVADYFDSLNALQSPIENIPHTTTASLSKTSPLPDSKIVRLVNGMQIEGFFSAKTALVLKNEWHDTIFCKAILTNIAADLRDRGIISHSLYENIYTKITNQDDLTHILYIFYAIMRFTEGCDVYKLDDLVKIPIKKLIEYVNTKELVLSKKYLETKINHLSQRYPELHENFVSLLDLLRNDNENEFCQALSKVFYSIRDKEGEGMQKIIFEELAEKSATKQPINRFIYLARMFKGQDFYSQHLRNITDITHAFCSLEHEDRRKLLDQASRAFSVTRHILADSKNIPIGSKTLFSLQHGLILGQWKKINTVFDNKVHAFCACHASAVSSEDKMWPLHHERYVSSCSTSLRDKNEEVIAVLGCNWGGGHKQAASNAAEIMEREGMHPHSIDIPSDMMEAFDKAKEKTGKFSIDQIVNKLAQFRAFSLLNLLRKIGGFNSIEPPPAKEKVKAALQRLLLVHPQIAISTIPSQTTAVVDACEIIGIPCSYIHTDVDRKIYNRDKPFSYAHCKAFLPYDTSVMVPEEYEVEPSEKTEIVGPSTKYVFDDKVEQENIDEVRSQLEKELQASLPRGKKLVIISSGANGAFSPYPELLAQKYKGKSADEIPFITVVLCGKNNPKFLHHVQSVASQLPQGMMIAKEFVAQNVMEKLYKVASFGGAVIGKAGGMSIFEISKCGTRLLIDAMPSKINTSQGLLGNIISVINWIANKIFGFKNYFAWEKVNQDFAISQGLAQRVTTQKEFFEKFDEALSFSAPVKLNIEVQKFSERLPIAVRSMLAQAQNDPNLRERRALYNDPILASSLV